jgi:hypothetical protein
MRLAPASALALAAVLALAAACSKPQPSPDYEEARRRYAELLKASPLDAHEKPEMAGVLELLERVPRESLDAEAAAELRKRILDERRALADQAARRAKLLEAAGAPVAGLPAGWTGSSAEPAPAAPAEAAASTEARPASELATGTTLDDFKKARGGCFEQKAPARLVRGKEKPVEGVAWGLRDDPACRKQNPAEVGRLVVFSEGKLVEVAEAASAKAQAQQQRVEGTRGADGTISLPPGVKLPPGATVKWDAQAAPAAPPATRR